MPMPLNIGNRSIVRSGDESLGKMDGSNRYQETTEQRTPTGSTWYAEMIKARA